MPGYPTLRGFAPFRNWNFATRLTFDTGSPDKGKDPKKVQIHSQPRNSYNAGACFRLSRMYDIKVEKGALVRDGLSIYEPLRFVAKDAFTKEWKGGFSVNGKKYKYGLFAPTVK